MGWEIQAIICAMVVFAVGLAYNCVRVSHKEAEEEHQRRHDEFFEEYGFEDRRINIDRRLSHRHDKPDRRKGH